MSREHDARIPIWIKRGNYIAMHICAYFVAILPDLCSNHCLNRLLEARWAWAGNQSTQKLYARLMHISLYRTIFLSTSSTPVAARFSLRSSVPEPSVSSRRIPRCSDLFTH